MSRPLFALVFWGLSLYCGSCAFDNDVAFIPEPLAAYWLVAEEQSSILSLLKILPDDAILWQYETSLGLNPDQISDLDLLGHELGLATASGQKVMTFGLPNETPLSTYNIAPNRPHMLALGETRLAVVDTNARKITWISRKDGTMIHDTLEGTVDRLYYMAPYFFLLEDSSRLKVWEENTLSLVENTLIPKAVDAVIKLELLNRIQFVSVEGSEKTLYSWDFGPQVLQLNGPSRYDKVEFSPYRRQNTGREWLGSIELRGDVLPRPGIQPVSDYRTDFFGAQLYYHDRDSLWGVDLHSDEQRFLAPFPYQIRQSRFYP